MPRFVVRDTATKAVRWPSSEVLSALSDVSGVVEHHMIAFAASERAFADDEIGPMSRSVAVAYLLDKLRAAFCARQSECVY
mgnify:CR=1 FL=1